MAHSFSHRSSPLRLLDQNWKSGRYHSNSGIRNATIYRSKDHTPKSPLSACGSAASLQFIAHKTSSDEPTGKYPRPTFTVSFESSSPLTHLLPKTTMMNYQTTHYNPITHVEVQRSNNLTANKLRSIGHFTDQTRDFRTNAVPEYVKTVENEPRTFFRRKGPFTKYSELCSQSSKPAFLQPLSLTPHSHIFS